MTRSLLVAICATLMLARAVQAETDVARWNRVMIEAAIATRSNDLVIARMLAVVHRATYDAWSVYDEQAAAINLDALTPPRPIRSFLTSSSHKRSKELPFFNHSEDKFGSERSAP